MKGKILGPTREYSRRFIAAPNDDVGGRLEISHMKAVCGAAVASEIQDARTRCPHRSPNGEQDGIAEPATHQNHRLAIGDRGWGSGRTHQDDGFAWLQSGAEV